MCAVCTPVTRGPSPPVHPCRSTHTYVQPSPPGLRGTGSKCLNETPRCFQSCSNSMSAGATDFSERDKICCPSGCSSGNLGLLVSLCTRQRRLQLWEHSKSPWIFFSFLPSPRLRDVFPLHPLPFAFPRRLLGGCDAGRGWDSGWGPARLLQVPSLLPVHEVQRKLFAFRRHLHIACRVAFASGEELKAAACLVSWRTLPHPHPNPGHQGGGWWVWRDRWACRLFLRCSSLSRSLAGIQGSPLTSDL